MLVLLGVVERGCLRGEVRRMWRGVLVGGGRGECMIRW